MENLLNTVIPSVKNQILVLDRLAEFYFSWVDNFIELMSEMTWEISFKELRSTILYLTEFWYIQRSYTWKWNEFFVKITKKWITYYEKVFEPNEKLHVKDSFLNKIKKFWEWINVIKWIATWVVAIFTIFWVTFHWEIKKQFSAKIILDNSQIQENEIKIQFTKIEAINFLKRRFSRDLEFSCKIKKENEIVCEVENQKIIPEGFHWTLEIKKTIPEKRIILKKNLDWKIILIK